MRAIVRLAPVLPALLIALLICCSKPPARYTPQLGGCEGSTYLQCFDRPLTLSDCQHACDDANSCGAFDFRIDASEGRCCLYGFGSHGFAIGFPELYCYVRTTFYRKAIVLLGVLIAAAIISACGVIPRGTYVPNAIFVTSSLYLYGEFANHCGILIQCLLVAVSVLMLLLVVYPTVSLSDRSTLTCIQLASFITLSCRCLVHPYLSPSELPLDTLSFDLLAGDHLSVQLLTVLVLLFVHCVLAFEHTQWRSKQVVAPSGEGIEALSVLVMMCACTCCVVCMVHKSHRSWVSTCIDQSLLVFLVAAALAYHIALRKQLVSQEIGCVQKELFSNACKSLSWRSKMTLCLLAAIFSFCMLLLNLILGHFSSYSTVSPLSSLGAACIGMVISAMIFLTTALSLHADSDPAARQTFQDGRFCMVAVLQALQQAVTFIAWLAGGTKDFRPLPLSGFTCKSDASTDKTESFRQSVRGEDLYWPHAKGSKCEIPVNLLWMCQVVNIQNCPSLLAVPCQSLTPGQEAKNGLFCMEAEEVSTASMSLPAAMLITLVVQIAVLCKLGIRKQLEDKTLRPALVAIGYRMALFASGIGSTCLVIGAWFGPSNILPESAQYFEFPLDETLEHRVWVGDSAAFALVWWMLFGFCAAAFLANELPSVGNGSASSADGVRTTVSTLLAFASPGVLLTLREMRLDASFSYIFHITSCCFICTFAGMLLIACGVGSEHQQLPANTAKALLQA